MKTIAEWDTEVREAFHAKQCALVEALYKLEEAGFYTKGEDFECFLRGYEAYLYFYNLKVLEASLPKLVKLFGKYNVENIWNGYADRMLASYAFKNKPSNLNIWFETSVADFPIGKYSPGCKIVAKQPETSYAVECPLKAEERVSL